LRRASSAASWAAGGFSAVIFSAAASDQRAVRPAPELAPSGNENIMLEEFATCDCAGQASAFPRGSGGVGSQWARIRLGAGS
jgi:hypothetical protein